MTASFLDPAHRHQRRASGNCRQHQSAKHLQPPEAVAGIEQQLKENHDQAKRHDGNEDCVLGIVHRGGRLEPNEMLGLESMISRGERVECHPRDYDRPIAD
jgi:hypothetical protein